MERLLHRHSRAFAWLCVLCAALAAPYLIPADRDAAVFRSGALSLLLLLAAAVPVEQAVSRARRETIAPCLLLALSFAFALSLGSELGFYQGLLPGSHAMLRRVAVPLLAAPLFFGLILRLTQIPAWTGKPLRLPFLLWVLLLMLAWLPVLLAYWPGMLNYDFKTERFYFLQGLYSKRNPLLYLFVNNFLLSLGGRIGAPNVGLFCSTLWHCLALAAALAYSLVFLGRRGVPRAGQLALFALYALHPMFSVMAVSQSKDVPFAACLLVLSLLAYDRLGAPDVPWSWRKRLLFLLMTAGTIHMRKNGIAAILPLFAALLLAIPARRLRTFLLLGASLGVSLLGLLAFELLPLDGQPTFQLLSVPAQQLVRAYHSGKLSPEEKAEIESWYYDAYGLVRIPQLADGAKGYLREERLQASLGDYASLWQRVGRQCPREYVEAFLLLNLGSWHPDDKTHSAIYAQTGAFLKGYLELNEYTSNEFTPTTLLPGVREWIEEICRYHAYQKVPLLSLLFAIATPFWALLLACALLRARGAGRLCFSAYGVLGCWLSYLFGPCALPRYSLPLFCLAPALLLLALCTPPREEAGYAGK